MFLIDNDQAEPRQRREYCQARPQHNVHLPCQGIQPGDSPLAGSQIAVQTDQPAVGKAANESFGQLRRQVDFRHQHQNLLTSRQDIGHPSQVNLGLAAAGDAMQQEGIEPIASGTQGGKHAFLLIGQGGHGFLRRHL
jgi:hypothetical protein